MCDQAGECWLQIYYMRHGLYDPRMVDEKVHKPKAVPLGPPRHPGRGALHPVLALRALLRRGDRHRRARHLQPGRPLGDRPLPGQDAREQVLGQRHRHLPGGRAHRPRVPLPGARVVPRHRPLGLQRVRARLQHRGTQQPAPARTTTRGAASRASSRATTPTSTGGGSATRAATASGWIDDESRLLDAGAARGRARTSSSAWDEAVADLVGALRRYRPEEIGILASPQMSNEDLFALQRIAGQLGIRAVDHRVPPRVPGEDDNLLIRADKNPNRRGRRARSASPRARPPRSSTGRGSGGSSCCGSSSTTSSIRGCRWPT